MDIDYITTSNIEWVVDYFEKQRVQNTYISFTSKNEFQIFLGNIETIWLFSLDMTYTGIKLNIKNMSSKDLKNFVIKCEVQTADHEIEAIIEDNYNDFNPETGANYNITSAEKIFNNPGKYLIDNFTLVLFLKFQLIKLKDKKIPDCANCSSNYTIFEDLFNKGLHSDFTFICSDGTKIPAHRFILIINTNVLKNLLDPNILKTKINMVHIKDIDGQTMTEILRFIYTKKVNNIETLAPKLICAAELYELNELKEFCAQSMIKKVFVHNALDYFILADQYKMRILLDYCIMYIKNNYKDVIEKIKDSNKLEVRHWKKLLRYFGNQHKFVVYSSLDENDC